MVKKDFSYGIIPLRLVEGTWQVLLVQHINGHYWAFPKGHAEQGESPSQAAVRELKEETGLEVLEFLPLEITPEHYNFTHQGELIEKTVAYFVAKVGGEISMQTEELEGVVWVPLSEASDRVTYENSREIARFVAQHLRV